jgi:hypothetical protein
MQKQVIRLRQALHSTTTLGNCITTIHVLVNFIIKAQGAALDIAAFFVNKYFIEVIIWQV